MGIVRDIKSRYKSTNGVYYLGDEQNDFEEIYIGLRQAEGRLYTDDEVKQLPDLDAIKKLAKEWRLRKKSAQVLIDYIAKSINNKSILDVGCGNGWLANKLAGIRRSEVIALDINKTELEQAAKAFTGDNIVFVYGDVLSLDMKFDYIILAGAAAYFKDLGKLISALLAKLNPNGEIHIIDSPFYNDTTIAEQRSAEYYTKLGFTGMIDYYHHHSFGELKGFNTKILYNPNTFFKKLARELGITNLPFHWIKITN
jgi:SAM-dependent methyltransferase